MATPPKTIVVTGATGAQGGGVVDALLSAGNRKVRAITRNASSQKAKNLAERGVEVVEADLNNKASLTKAFTGADELFLVTDFYGAGFSYDSELKQGKTAIDAAKEAGVGSVIFSYPEDPPKDVKGGLPRLEDGRTIAHFESKHDIGEYLTKSGLPYTLLITCMFYDNMLTFTMYQRQADGSYVFSNNLGNEPHGAHSVSTIGQTVAAVLEDPQKYNGKTVPVVGEQISQPQMAQIVSDVTGKDVKYHAMSDEQMASLPMPAAQDLTNMFAYYRKWDYYDQLRPLSERLVSGPTFKEWAEAHRDALKAKLESS